MLDENVKSFLKNVVRGKNKWEIDTKMDAEEVKN